MPPTSNWQFAVHEFSESHGRDGDFDFSEGLPNRREQISHGLPFPLRCDDYA